MRNRFIPEVESRLRAAHWYSGRRISDEELERIDEEKPLFLYAQRAIEEFGGIYVEPSGTWRSSSSYRRSFCISPYTLMGDDDLKRFEILMERRVYPLGFIDYRAELSGAEVNVTGEYAMFIDEYGCVFAFHHFTGDMHLLIGTSIDQALNNVGAEKGLRLWDLANDVPLEPR